MSEIKALRELINMCSVLSNITIAEQIDAASSELDALLAENAELKTAVGQANWFRSQIDNGTVFEENRHLRSDNDLLRKQLDEAIDALKTIIRTGRINGHISFANAIEVTYSDLLNQMKKGE
jgi:hypothetical protein